MIAVFAPGQGSQTPGMLAPWLELPGVAEELAAFSEATGLDLVRLGTTADADEIKDTAVTQPLIVALGTIVSTRLGLDSDAERVVAGHSVGELTAAAVSGALTPVEAVAFAARRGAEMAAACALDADRHVRDARRRPRRGRRRASRPPGSTPANRNGAGQIVAAGALDALERLAENPPAGARVRPLRRRRRVPHRLHEARRGEAARVRRHAHAGRPAADPAVERRRLGRHDGRRPDRAARPPGHPAGALGPVPAHLRRPRRHRRVRARPGRAPSPASRSAS